MCTALATAGEVQGVLLYRVKRPARDVSIWRIVENV